MLKNWVVITQPVRDRTDGLMKREHYLGNENHQNHANTEAIVQIFGDEKTVHRMALLGEKYRLRQKLVNRQGGRPLSSFAVEYCLTLPKGVVRPSKRQWQSIVRDVCKSLVLAYKLSESETKLLSKQVRAVCHMQRQDGALGTGDHVHLIIGKVVGNRVLTELQKKSATHIVKQSFNTAVMKYLRLSTSSYQVQNGNRGKRLEMWRFFHKASQEKLETIKLINRLQKQADRWFNALESGETKIARKYNRMNLTLRKLEELVVEDEVKQNLALLKSHIDAQARERHISL
ncbi:hypothetical protein L3Q72_12735 [Vibrio sp. JC009]|uniref:hypothetical protein n=1 Tax=Vibrio sp. JC009 TaxID=2912314 RepID=UPI0023B0415A|nr:hypothetical protein [Vibrio sp. JC009]WED21482.1 hypothetical protein L3Q72_12735 [Vibrio sp. JC009]